MKGCTLGEGLLVGLLAVGVLLHVLIDPDLGRRNVEFMPDMAFSPAFKAQEPNPVFRDGATLQAPVPGTVARGQRPLMALGLLLDVTTPDWKKLPAEQQVAWDAYAPHWTWEGLAEPDRLRAAARGATVFGQVCATCHGLDGLGKTPVTQRGTPPPPSLLDERIQEMSDGHLYRIITAGQGNMAPHANQVARDDRWMVIRHLRSLQKPTE